MDWTHVEDVEDPVEILPPSSDCTFIAPRVEETRGWIPFSLLDNVLLDRGHSPAIGTLVTGSLDVRLYDSTHVVSLSIAPNTDLLGSSVRLSLNPRSRAWHTSAQDIPSLT